MTFDVNPIMRVAHTSSRLLSHDKAKALPSSAFNFDIVIQFHGYAQDMCYRLKQIRRNTLAWRHAACKGARNPDIFDNRNARTLSECHNMQRNAIAPDFKYFRQR